MRRTAMLVTVGVAFASSAESQSIDRGAGWRADIDSLARSIVRTHPNPWAHRSREAFLAEASALRDSVPDLSDARVLAGMMRLAASIGDGHTSLVDLGSSAGTAWFPVRFALFADGLWVTAIAPEHAAIAGKRVATIGGRSVDKIIAKWLPLAQGDNVFNRRTHSAMLSNAAVMNALGFTKRFDTLRFEIESANGRREGVTVGASKGTGSLEWEQWGEMFGPPTTTLTTAFGIAPDAYLTSDAKPTLPLHLRDRRPYRWTYVPVSRTLYFQLNNVVAQSRRIAPSMLETWSSALAFADSQSGRIDRFVLDLRYNSGGDGSLNPAFMRQLIKRETLTRSGHFFVLTSGKTFSAATDLVVELLKYTQPMLVGEPPGAGLNASGDAGHIRLPFSNAIVSISTRYTQLAQPTDTLGVIAVNIPAPMRGAEYFRGGDPALDAIWSAPTPNPNVITSLRDSGGTVAHALWNGMRSRYGILAWWEPWRWQELNKAAYELLEHGRTDDAVAGFAINAERNPRLWETWDSLGEAYLKAGRKDDALRCYLRALELAPDNWNASEQLRIVAAIRAGKTD